MPLRLNVGVSRKVGLPSYSSVGASCHIELDLELEPGVLESDLDGFHLKVRSAYVAANQAVNDELDRLRAVTTGPSVPPPIEGDKPAAGRPPERPGPPSRSPHPGERPPARPASASQARAIRALARRSGDDLDGLLCDLDVAKPEDLSMAGASRLIDQLKAIGAG